MPPALEVDSVSGRWAVGMQEAAAGSQVSLEASCAMGGCSGIASSLEAGWVGERCCWHWRWVAGRQAGGSGGVACLVGGELGRKGLLGGSGPYWKELGRLLTLEVGCVSRRWVWDK